MLKLLKLILTGFVWSTISASAFASICANEIQQRPGESRSGETVCNNCRSITDFAKYGAALLQDNHQSTLPQFNRVLVKNTGREAVWVSVQAVTLDTPVTIGAGIFGINIKQGHRGVLAVYATPTRGNLVGSPWTGAWVQKSELSKVCKAIQLEKKAKEQQKDDLAHLSQEVSSRGHRPSGDEVARLTGRAPSNWFGRNSRYNYISCYTVWGPNGSTTRCPRSR